MNTRLLTARKALRLCGLSLFWIPTAFFSLLLIRNTLPYFSFNQEFSFIQERAMLFLQPIYKWSFYSHIFAGMFCIGAALVQFSSYILKKRKAIHIWFGRIYVFVVLFIGAPTGLYMSFFAKGTFAERGLFMFMAATWFFTTLRGLQAVLNKNILAHKLWMIRSYAMAMTAVTFRVYHIFFYYYGVDHLKNYEVSLWISVLGNILVAEWLVYQRSRQYLQTFTQ